jgi:hypothetical protein
MQEVYVEGSQPESGLDKKWDLTWKLTEAKRAKGTAQVVEHLPSKNKALTQFNPQYHQF